MRELETGKDGWIGWGGSRGAAKSHALRSGALYLGFRYPGIHVLLFRRTYPMLWENHIMKILEEWPQLKRWYNEDHKTLTLPTQPSRSVIHFRYADTMKDLLEFKGKEYGAVLIDEATDLTEEEIRVITSCCRSTLRGWRPKRALTFNPGGVGHMFVKRLFIDQELTDQERRQGVKFIQAFPWDNVFHVCNLLEERGLTTKDYWAMPEDQRISLFLESEYGKELASNERWSDAWLWGKWDILAGAYFGLWRKELHTYDPAKLERKPYWPVWIGIDWGFVHDSAVEWFTTDGNRIYTFREWCQSGLSATQLAEGIIKGSEGMKIASIQLSHDAFNKDISDRTIAIQMGEVLQKAGLPLPERCDNDRHGGWQVMYDALRNGQWQISTDCTKLVRVIPLLQRNIESKNPLQQEDILKVDGDDPADAARYAMKVRPPLVSLPVEDRLRIRFEEKVGAPPDKVSPTWAAIQMRTLEHELDDEESPTFFGAGRGMG